MLLAEVCLALWVAAMDMTMAAVFGGALSRGEALVSQRAEALALCQGELAAACRLAGQELQPETLQTVYANGVAWTVRSAVTREANGLARIDVQVGSSSAGSSTEVSMWSWQADANIS